MNILITGASGFIGSRAIPILQAKHNISTVSLRGTSVEQVDFKNIDAILHLAGVAHKMTEIDPKQYFKINHSLTVNLAKAAKANGVDQFVFISSIKVYGDSINQVFSEDSECFPSDPYGESKLLAEQDLIQLQNDHFAVSIIRPALVYGPNVKGNLDRLLALIKNLPFLPFNGINNQRSMVFVDNLIALILHVISNKYAGIFNSVDHPRHSTSHLVNTIMKHMNVQKVNFKLPRILIGIIARIKPKLYTRLFESYIIDNKSTIEKLNFVQPYSFDDGIKAMVDAYNERN